MKFFVLATCHEANDHTSFIVGIIDAAKCWHDAQQELKRRIEKAGVQSFRKYVIVQFTRVE